MRVLVSGGAGYIGSRVTAYLLGRGAEVTVYDSLVYGGSALLPFVGDPSFHLIAGDVRDREAMTHAMREADAVVHLAAIVGEPACARDELLAEQVNHEGALAAMAIAEATGIDRFLFFSTCSNYGAANAGAIVDETSPLDPLSTYARTKVAAEQAALSGARKPTTTVLRLGTACGPSARMRFDLLVNDMARAAALERPIEIYKPEAWRPYVHVADVGRLVEHALMTETSRVANRVFNVVAENYRKSDLVALVRKHFPNAVVTLIDAQPDNRDYRVSGDLIRDELGFETNHTVEDAFVEVAGAVKAGVFVNPLWPGFGNLPIEAAVHG